MGLLEDKIAAVGLGKHTDRIVAVAKNAIVVESAAGAEFALGSSRMGGSPDLSRGVEYPSSGGRRLPFVAQISLGETRPFDVGGMLPHAGMLYFFYDAARWAWGYNLGDRDAFRVLYSAEATDLRRTEPPAGVSEIYQEAGVGFHAAANVPLERSKYIKALGMGHEEMKAYSRLREEINGNGEITKLLGHPDQVQEDMQYVCPFVTNGIDMDDPDALKSEKARELARSYDDWTLLLQVHSDENCGMMWGDSGRIFFWIRKSDLAERNFDDCWAVLQCS